MAHAIHADYVASITELKKDPMGTFASGDGEVIAILNRNEPAFYLVPPNLFEQMVEMLEDVHLSNLVKKRLEANQPRVRAEINSDGEITFEEPHEESPARQATA